MIHAIGGAANNVILNVFENVIIENGERDRRFRVEHAHNIRTEDIGRFGRVEDHRLDAARAFFRRRFKSFRTVSLAFGNQCKHRLRFGFFDDSGQSV